MFWHKKVFIQDSIFFLMLQVQNLNFNHDFKPGTFRCWLSSIYPMTNILQIRDSNPPPRGLWCLESGTRTDLRHTLTGRRPQVNITTVCLSSTWAEELENKRPMSENQIRRTDVSLNEPQNKLIWACPSLHQDLVAIMCYFGVLLNTEQMEREKKHKIYIMQNDLVLGPLY